jgi:hypothetical protein
MTDYSETDAGTTLKTGVGAFLRGMASDAPQDDGGAGDDLLRRLIKAADKPADDLDAALTGKVTRRDGGRVRNRPQPISTTALNSPTLTADLLRRLESSGVFRSPDMVSWIM